MQRRATKQTRGVSAAEKKFQRWVKESPCCNCHSVGPSIVDHVKGSAYKIKLNLVTVLVGGWYVIPLCHQCDATKTQGSHRKFEKEYGVTQRELWLGLVDCYDSGVPGEIVAAIKADDGMVKGV